MSTITYIVKVASSKFTIDGAVAPKLTFRDGDTYVFDQADASNSGHTLQFSATSNNSGSSEYSTGVTKTGTPGNAGAKTTIVTSSSTTDTLYYYSSGGGTHGEEFSNTGFNTSTNFNLLKPIVGAESTAEKWGSMVNHMVDQIDQNISTLPYLDNTTTDQNLSGTYSTERMYFNDSYKLTGDVNVTGHLALATAADSDVVITQDSTEREITGSGTLESGRLMNDPTTSLTGMTGELGSGATFPAGHVVQTTVPVRGLTYTTGLGGWNDSVVSGSITPIYDDSAILIFATFQCAISAETTSDTSYALRVKKTGTGVTNTYGSPLIGPTVRDEGYSYMYRTNYNYSQLNNTHVLNGVDEDCETTNEITYRIQYRTYHVDNTFTVGGNGWNNLQWSIWFQEIKR